jgi:hypothetical protein
MNLPELNADGYLEPGIYLVRLHEVLERFGIGTPAREQQGALLRLIVGSARKYPVLSVAKDQWVLRGIWIIFGDSKKYAKGIQEKGETRGEK